MYTVTRHDRITIFSLWVVHVECRDTVICSSLWLHFASFHSFRRMQWYYCAIALRFIRFALDSPTSFWKRQLHIYLHRQISLSFPRALPWSTSSIDSIRYSWPWFMLYLPWKSLSLAQNSMNRFHKWLAANRFVALGTRQLEYTSALHFIVGTKAK